MTLTNKAISPWELIFRTLTVIMEDTIVYLSSMWQVVNCYAGCNSQFNLSAWRTSLIVCLLCNQHFIFSQCHQTADTAIFTAIFKSYFLGCFCCAESNRHAPQDLTLQQCLTRAPTCGCGRRNESTLTAHTSCPFICFIQ